MQALCVVIEETGGFQQQFVPVFSARSCNFCISRVTTHNMETTIYWKSNSSNHDANMTYTAQYNCDRKWISVPCPSPRWHGSSGEWSCVVLTCASTPLDEYCEIRLEAHGNSSGRRTHSIIHDPTTDSMFVVCGALGRRI